MKLIPLSPKKALNKAFLKQRPLRSDIDLFKTNLIKLLGKIDEIEREENQKNHIRDFLLNTYYKDSNEINTKGSQDLAIHTGKNNKTPVGVIVEAKRPGNKADWISAGKPNGKALHELVLYYLRERIEENNNNIQYLIATNIYEWYIIESHHFERLFYRNKTLVKQYEDWRNRKKVASDTKLFYTEIVKPFIDGVDEKIPCIFFDIRDYGKFLKQAASEEDKNLIALFKILSPNHLLRVPFVNDSNSLDERFYKELLHIIGLEEAKEGSKNIIRRKIKDRNAGSLIENTISAIEAEDPFHKIPDISAYGADKDSRLFNISLELVITWINRILFLKLLEGQLVNYHKGNKQYRFLDIEMINDFHELFKLFHGVLAVTLKDRKGAILKKYSLVPYLNSSLFEFSELEDLTVKISSLDNSEKLELINTTILKDIKKKSPSLPTLDYLFKFLDAYDFASEGKEDIQDDSKTLINASVLGKVFEKINGYKDGAYFTPGFITMHMCREAIRLAVVQKFKDRYGWDVERFDDLKNFMAGRKTGKNILEFNGVINSLRLCDPAVGSGHFLVSSLNEIIAIKAELGLLADDKGICLTGYEIEISNDELIIADSNGNIFEYQMKGGKPVSKESQRVQTALFREKQTIIENCLFGVDINSNSVKICRLRLWIELLKNAYYKEDTNYEELETLPNIDINIKCGNSLLNRFSLSADMSKPLASIKHSMEDYRNAVQGYKNEKNRDAKRKLDKLINTIKTEVKTEIFKTHPKKVALDHTEVELESLSKQQDMFDDAESKKERESRKRKLSAEIDTLKSEIKDLGNNVIYKTAFEWRFEFPEVLDDAGAFKGFDVVIGNPPYIKEYEHKEVFDGLRDKECYQGKMDLWYLFGGLGLGILSPGAYLSYIATNNWVTNSGASNFRNILIRDGEIVSLIDFGPYMIFDSASIQTMIMLFKKDSSIDGYSFDYRRLNGENLGVEDALGALNKINGKTAAYLSPTVNRATMRNKHFVFNTVEHDVLLDKIKSKQNFYLRERADKSLNYESEVANGIHHHHDVINDERAAILGRRFRSGNGIFVLSQEEYTGLQLFEKEKEIIKPNYTTKELKKYYGSPVNKSWVIYTKSNMGKVDPKTGNLFIDNYPNIKRHLDKFKSVITSDFRPYGLHRSREQHFFEGEKIIVTRKCPKEPTFTYTDFPCYVSATFYIIQSDRINLKYLTGLLNSTLIAFWLRHKGKMQGNNYQLDKEPLLEIPIYKPSDEDMKKIASLVDEVISAKQQGLDSTETEKKIDLLVYNLYDFMPEDQAIIGE